MFCKENGFVFYELDGKYENRAREFKFVLVLGNFKVEVFIAWKFKLVGF